MVGRTRWWKADDTGFLKAYHHVRFFQTKGLRACSRHYCTGSADLMRRNLERRVETFVRVEDQKIKVGAEVQARPWLDPDSLT